MDSGSDTYRNDDAFKASQFRAQCLEYFFRSKNKNAAQKKELREAIALALRTKVTYPESALKFLQSYADAAVSCAEQLDWSVQEMYAPEEKAEIILWLHDHSFMA